MEKKAFVIGNFKKRPKGIFSFGRFWFHLNSTRSSVQYWQEENQDF